MNIVINTREEELKEAIINIDNFKIELNNKDEKISSLYKEITSLQKKNKKLQKQIKSAANVTNKPVTRSVNTSTSTTFANQYKLTSFWANDGSGSGNCTGTGLCTKDFQINDKGWYTYQGKLVIGAATPYLLKYGYKKRNNIRYFKYYETINLIIDNIEYQGIILDSCGACMKNNILDLFVSGKKSSITKKIFIK